MTKTLAKSKVLYALRIDPDLLDAARKVQERTGTPVTWQIETALAEWLARKGGPKRRTKAKTATRKQSSK